MGSDCQDVRPLKPYVESRGTILPIADGPDMLVDDEATDGPAWLVSRERPVVAIQSDQSGSTVLDADGTVLGVGPVAGEVVWMLPGASIGHTLAASPSGRWAALMGSDVTVGRRDGVVDIISLDGAHAGALAFTGEVLAVALADGVVRLFPAEGER